jgi:hypothetical protein
MGCTVVTFSNQLGADGVAIARAVAAKTGFRYYDWEIISQAAAEAGVSPEVVAVAEMERSPNLIERILHRLGTFGEAEEPSAAAPAARMSIMTSDDYRQFIEHVIRGLADAGEAVIVNHAGQAILRDRPAVLKVLVRGSQEIRAARLAGRQGIAREQALANVRQSDSQRSDFFRRAYHMDWLSAAAYDVTLNTDVVATDLAADFVAAVALAAR